MFNGDIVDSLFPKPSQRVLSSPGKRRSPDTKVQWPRDFRKFMGWIFLASSPQFAIISVRSTWSAAHKFYYPVPPVRNLLYAPTFSVLVVIIFVTAWWTIWKGKRSARAWGIAASVMFVIAFARQFIVHLTPAFGHYAGYLFIGIVGLFTFSWPRRHAT